MVVGASLMAMRAYALDPSASLDAYERQIWATESGLPQNTVNAILQTHDAFLWIGTDGGLARFDGYQFTVFTTDNDPSLPSNRIVSLEEDSSGNLIVTTRSGSVTRTAEGWRRLNSKPASAHATGEFTPSLRGLTQRTGSGSKTYTVAQGLPSNRINTLFQDAEGSLWIGTESGLARMRDGRIQTFPANDVLGNESILSIAEDRDGDLWVGTDENGIVVLRDRMFVSHTGRSNGLDRGVWAVLADPADNSIWLGTDGNGLLHINKEGAVDHSAVNAKLTSQIVLSLALDRDGSLWAGTPDGLNRVNGNRVDTLTSNDGLPDDFVQGLYSDPSGGVWAGTRHGLCRITGVRSPIAVYTAAKNGLASDIVGPIARDSSGTLWAGTARGLCILNGDRFRNVASGAVTDLYLSRHRRLYAAIQNRGLLSITANAATPVQSPAGIPKTVYGMTEDGAGDLWLASNSGIYRLSGSAAVQYGTSDGLRVTSSSAGGRPVAITAQNGDLWFAMSRGVAMLTSGHSHMSAYPPATALESILLNDQVYDPGAVARVPASVTRIAFEYAGISLRAPQKVRYRYKLENFDNDWIDAGSRRVAYYTNLAPGEYVFQVTAENGDGVWNRLATTAVFTVEPHWYQTWWFLILVLAALAGAVYSAYIVRVHQMQARYDAVLAERNRIAREIHDTLAQGFIGVSVQLEIVSRLLNSSVEKAREQLDNARTLVRQSIADARASIWELRSQEAANQDLASRISNVAKQVTASSGIKPQVAVHGEYRALKSNIEDELLRICQEALTNAVRHSGASRVDIDLTFNSKLVRLSVADNGKGFDHKPDATGPAGHFGVKGMGERAARIDATLSIESNVGKGTTVVVEAPAK